MVRVDEDAACRRLVLQEPACNMILTVSFQNRADGVNLSYLVV
jgi:hypothetical protein